MFWLIVFFSLGVAAAIVTPLVLAHLTEVNLIELSADSLPVIDMELEQKLVCSNTRIITASVPTGLSRVYACPCHDLDHFSSIVKKDLDLYINLIKDLGLTDIHKRVALMWENVHGFIPTNGYVYKCVNCQDKQDFLPLLGAYGGYYLVFIDRFTSLDYNILKAVNMSHCRLPPAHGLPTATFKLKVNNKLEIDHYEVGFSICGKSDGRFAFALDPWLIVIKETRVLLTLGSIDLTKFVPGRLALAPGRQLRQIKVKQDHAISEAVFDLKSVNPYNMSKTPFDLISFEPTNSQRTKHEQTWSLLRSMSSGWTEVKNTRTQTVCCIPQRPSARFHIIVAKRKGEYAAFVDGRCGLFLIPDQHGGSLQKLDFPLWIQVGWMCCMQGHQCGHYQLDYDRANCARYPRGSILNRPFGDTILPIFHDRTKYPVYAVEKFICLAPLIINEQNIFSVEKFITTECCGLEYTTDSYVPEKHELSSVPKSVLPPQVRQTLASRLQDLVINEGLDQNWVNEVIDDPVPIQPTSVYICSIPVLNREAFVEVRIEPNIGLMRKYKSTQGALNDHWTFSIMAKYMPLRSCSNFSQAPFRIDNHEAGTAYILDLVPTKQKDRKSNRYNIVLPTNQIWKSSDKPKCEDPPSTSGSARPTQQGQSPDDQKAKETVDALALEKQAEAQRVSNTEFRIYRSALLQQRIDARGDMRWSQYQLNLQLYEREYPDYFVQDPSKSQLKVRPPARDWLEGGSDTSSIVSYDDFVDSSRKISTQAKVNQEYSQYLSTRSLMSPTNTVLAISSPKMKSLTLAREPDAKHLLEKPVFLIIGPTRVGKTLLANKLGAPVIPSDDYESDTFSWARYEISNFNQQFSIIDTIGYDDTRFHGSIVQFNALEGIRKTLSKFQRVVVMCLVYDQQMDEDDKFETLLDYFESLNIPVEETYLMMNCKESYRHNLSIPFKNIAKPLIVDLKKDAIDQKFVDRLFDCDHTIELAVTFDDDIRTEPLFKTISQNLGKGFEELLAMIKPGLSDIQIESLHKKVAWSRPLKNFSLKKFEQLEASLNKLYIDVEDSEDGLLYPPKTFRLTPERALRFTSTQKNRRERRAQKDRLSLQNTSPSVIKASLLKETKGSTKGLGIQSGPESGDESDSTLILRARAIKDGMSKEQAKTKYPKKLYSRGKRPTRKTLVISSCKALEPNRTGFYLNNMTGLPIEVVTASGKSIVRVNPEIPSITLDATKSFSYSGNAFKVSVHGSKFVNDWVPVERGDLMVTINDVTLT
jgi:hypothetical protein